MLGRLVQVKLVGGMMLSMLNSAILFGGSISKTIVEKWPCFSAFLKVAIITHIDNVTRVFEIFCDGRVSITKSHDKAVDLIGMCLSVLEVGFWSL